MEEGQAFLLCRFLDDKGIGAGPFEGVSLGAVKDEFEQDAVVVAAGAPLRLDHELERAATGEEVAFSREGDIFAAAANIEGGRARHAVGERVSRRPGSDLSLVDDHAVSIADLRGDIRVEMRQEQDVFLGDAGKVRGSGENGAGHADGKKKQGAFEHGGSA